MKLTYLLKLFILQTSILYCTFIPLMFKLKCYFKLSLQSLSVSLNNFIPILFANFHQQNACQRQKVHSYTVKHVKNEIVMNYSPLDR